MTTYCVEEEEEQWLHPWFRVNAATPPALALCPSLLKAFASEAASLPDLRQRDDTIAQPSDLASTFSRDSQLISDCQPQRPPSSLGMPIHHDKNVLQPAQWANGDHHRRLERGYMHGGMDRGWFAR